ncbi:relaxin-3 receptor 1 [Clarias gariepinus]|uniref:relaxin-3 receptor 1 n=1 Tax=Clarias gariepinus TaxID=13013 RepID=UPI00234D19B4|nr:relaxin-3 receptor 1 [Clarias gariepinus]
MPLVERLARLEAMASLVNMSLSNFSDLGNAGSASGSSALRFLISLVYSFVCAVGLVGNLLVFFLMRSRQGRRPSTINLFILNLAATDFQFVLVLPFWAVDTARDFSWPFGHVMCKVVLSVTVMNMYASVFFLTAMSITRYWAVASALKNRRRHCACSGRWVSALLWLLATIATTPTMIFSAQKKVLHDDLCLMSFPGGDHWLGLYHLQKVLFGFVFPMLIVCVCYVLLLRFLRLRSMNNNLLRRKSRVTRSVTVVVLSFFICWMPNQAVTFWGVLVKLDAMHFDQAYFFVQTYIFPVTACLAHANSCLNPVLYCLTRREFRKMLKDLFWRISTPSMSNSCQIRPFSGSAKGEPEDSQAVIPLNVVESEQYRVSLFNAQCDTIPTAHDSP